MAPTPLTSLGARRSISWVACALLIIVASACSATPSWIPVETATENSLLYGPEGTAPAELAYTSDGPGTDDPALAEASRRSGAAADSDDPVEAADPASQAAPSTAFCTASAKIWSHSAALNLLGTGAGTEMTKVAMANVAEWLERSTLFVDEPDGELASRREMLAAFDVLQVRVGEDFDYDWSSFQAGSVYANDPAAQRYEAARSDLVPFLNNGCPTVSMRELREEAEERADELRSRFAAEPSTVVESDTLEGHSIFTHSSGRLIASFPTAWEHDEGRSDAIVDLIASPDIERFLDGEAIDGVRLQLVEAATLEEFRRQIDATMIATDCERTNDLLDTGAVRLNITQTYTCADHGASIIGQYSEDRGLGLVIEAGFDRVEASRADLIRLASIANSALWS